MRRVRKALRRMSPPRRERTKSCSLRDMAIVFFWRVILSKGCNDSDFYPMLKVSNSVWFVFNLQTVVKSCSGLNIPSTWEMVESQQLNIIIIHGEIIHRPCNCVNLNCFNNHSSIFQSIYSIIPSSIQNYSLSLILIYAWIS